MYCESKYLYESLFLLIMTQRLIFVEKLSRKIYEKDSTTLTLMKSCLGDMFADHLLMCAHIVMVLLHYIVLGY